MLTQINFQDHPTNRRMKVFFFRKVEEANYFEVMLVESKIEYEKQIDQAGDQRIYYGVKVKDFKAAKKLNFLTIGHFRKPFIPDAFFRYFIITISIVILTLAISGAILSST